ncbi:hypothetical protein ZWY2020_050026 [Hordeum vulgare]|nr:hypothetical protein ZWY2020_050026 [Hordeum vulgare]
MRATTSRPPSSAASSPPQDPRPHPLHRAPSSTALHPHRSSLLHRHCVTNRAVGSPCYREYRLGVLHRCRLVEDADNWARIRSCLRDGSVCQSNFLSLKPIGGQDLVDVHLEIACHVGDLWFGRVSDRGRWKFFELCQTIFFAILNITNKLDNIISLTCNYVEACLCFLAKGIQKTYEGYVPMEYNVYLKKMKRSAEWGII